MRTCKKIELGEVFEVDGKLYVINKPTTPSQDENENGHIISTLYPIDDEAITIQKIG